jgi:hypothetical protein
VEEVVDIWLNSALDRGEVGPIDQFHERREAVKFDRDGYIEVEYGDRKRILIPNHKVDHVEIRSR